MNILKAVERGIEAAKQTFDPKKYQAAGKPVRCSHCGGDVFEMPRGTIGKFSGYVLQCCHCGHLECFGKEPTEIK
jgi:DNA-directed RNA polymerase subunit RPC12/RpoP